MASHSPGRTIQAWRVGRAVHADLSGEGARRFGGRWNSPGLPMVYLAEHPALAVLEVRVHLDLPPDLLPDDYVLMRVDLPDERPEEVATMPPDPRAVGDAWLRSGRTAVLRVPSAIVPNATNLLLNPRHPRAADAQICMIQSFQFDARLWRGARPDTPERT
jgi:RES domain-containing protein